MRTARLEAPALFLVVTALYAFTIGSTPVRVDEYYTLFAARSWANDGSFAILDGEYTRARLFTMMIGMTFDLFGNTSLMIARLPTVVMAGALVTLLFVWIRNRAGHHAAIAAALILALSGYTLDVAHFARFYAPQALVVLGGAMLVHQAASSTGAAMATRLMAAGTLLLLGYHLQPTTLIAAGAISLWFLVERFDLIKAPLQRHPVYALVAAAILCSAALAVLPQLADRYMTASVWAQDHRYDRLFYLAEFYRQIPLLVLLFPLAAGVAVRRDRSLATLALTIIFAGLILHSFAAMKAGRYVYYTMPFIAMIFGLAATGAARAATAFGKRILRAAGAPAVLAAGGAKIALFCIGMALLLVNSSYRHTVGTGFRSFAALRTSAPFPRPTDDFWDREENALRRVIAPGDFLVASDDLRTMAHLRPHDMLINASHLSDLATTRDFTIDVRTGRPILASVAGLERMIDCRPSGLILIDDAHWRTNKGVSPAVADRIELRALPVMPAIDHFHMFRWHRLPTATCPWMRVKGSAA